MRCFNYFKIIIKYFNNYFEQEKYGHYYIFIFEYLEFNRKEILKYFFSPWVIKLEA
jgi:hypothetical protein